MKLYKLTQYKNVGYSCLCAIVVRAADIETARVLAKSRAGREGEEAWDDAEVEDLSESEVEGIICEDFHRQCLIIHKHFSFRRMTQSSKSLLIAIDRIGNFEFGGLALEVVRVVPSNLILLPIPVVYKCCSRHWRFELEGAVLGFGLSVFYQSGKE